MQLGELPVESEEGMGVHMLVGSSEGAVFYLRKFTLCGKGPWAISVLVKLTVRNRRNVTEENHTLIWVSSTISSSSTYWLLQIRGGEKSFDFYRSSELRKSARFLEQLRIDFASVGTGLARHSQADSSRQMA